MDTYSPEKGDKNKIETARSGWIITSFLAFIGLVLDTLGFTILGRILFLCAAAWTTYVMSYVIRYRVKESLKSNIFSSILAALCLLYTLLLTFYPAAQ